MVSVIFAVLEVSFWALTTVVKLLWKFFTLIEIIYDIRSAVILVLLDRNNFINISNSVGRHHWRPLVNADKAADILSGVLHSMSGMLYILIR